MYCAAFGLRNDMTTKSACTCLGYPQTYVCAVVGEPGGTTVWQGSAFNCTSGEISLFHDRYESDEGALGDCNNGDIVGRSLRAVSSIDNNNSTVTSYVSQLSVTVSSNIIGKSIECVHDDGTTQTPTIVGHSTITATTGD